MPKLKLIVLVFLGCTAAKAQQVSLMEGTLTNEIPDLTSFDPEPTKSVDAELLALTPGTFQHHPEFGIVPFNAQCDDCVELIDRRTESTRYFIQRGSGGKVFYVQQSYGKLHYYNETGHLRTIDSRLKRHSKREGVFLAPYQELPIKVDLEQDYTSMVLEDGFELKFNQQSLLWGKSSDKLIEQASNASNYEAGKDGVLNNDYWKDIDREVVVGHGEIKTNYILQRTPDALADASEGVLSFDQWIRLPASYSLIESDGYKTDQGWWFGELSLQDETGKELARFGKPIVFDDSMNTFAKDRAGTGYVIRRETDGVWLELRVDLAWLNDPSRVFPVTIDPLVTGTNTYGAGVMGFESDATCWNQGNYCSYNMSVTVPGKSTLTSAIFDAQYQSLNFGCGLFPCWMSEAAFRIYGSCGNSPGAGLYWTCIPPNGNAPGDCTGAGLDMSGVVSCEGPQCPDYNLTFEMRTYHCSCSTGPCATSCHRMPNNTWVVTIQGRTVESTASVTGPNPICDGQATTITSSGSYGVPGYTYSWMPGGLTGPTQTVSPTSTTTYTVTVTDQCNETSQSMVTVTVNPLPTLSFSNVDVSCLGGSDGSSTVTASGGSSFFYAWNTVPPQGGATANNLSAGSYTVTVTNNFGCQTIGNVTINEPATAVTASITSSTDVSCYNGTDGSATAVGAGGTPGYTYAWNTTPPQSTATANNLSAAPYTVTVTDSKGCWATASVTIAEPADLILTISGTDPSCFGGSDGMATVSASNGTPPYSYVWNTTPPQSTSVATGLSSGSYTVTVTDSKGCFKIASVTLGQPTDIVLTTSSTNASCATSADGAASVSASGGTPGYTYLWNTTPPQGNPTATGLNPGNYTVTVTDANGCQKIVSVTVGVNSSMTLAMSSTAVTCNGGTDGTATATPGGGSPPYTYLWNTTPPQSTATASGITAGGYSVTVTDASGCQITGAVTVLEPLAITLTMTSTDAACAGATDGSASVTASGGTPGYTYLWSTTPPQSTTTANNLGPGLYTLTVTDANGCQQTGSVTVGTASTMTLSFTKTDATCNGWSDGTATASVSNGIPPFSYAWSTTPPQSTATAVGLSVGSWTLTVTDAAGCQAIGSVIINEPPAITLTLSPVDPLCNGGSDGTATVTPANGTAPFSYLWNTTPPQNTATAVGLSAGSYSVTVTDANGCQATGSTALADPVAMSAGTSTTDITCNGYTDGTATATGSGGTPPYAYAWSTTPVQNTATASNLSSGNYTVTVTDANGCFVTAQVVIAEPPALTVSAAAVDESCFGLADGQVSASPLGGTPPFTYTWNTTPVQTTQTATNLGAGVYTVTATDGAGCTSTASATVGSPPQLTATIVPTDATCYGYADGALDLTVMGGTPPYSFAWSNSSTNEDISGLAAGSYSVVVTDAAGCTVSATGIVAEPAEIIVTLGVDLIIEQGQSVILSGLITPAGSYSFSWQPPTGLDNPNTDQPSAAPLAPTTYTLTVTDASGCSGSDDIRVDVIPPTNITLPSAFSPNGDGLNDIFFDPAILGIELVSLRIYNRWGETLHSGTQPWDGTAYNEDQPVGTYVYDVTIKFEGTEFTRAYRGNVTLLR